ncbi:hypothetical protein JCM15519_20520 [Fundidesulfovibrio butyratiphilus]
MSHDAEYAQKRMIQEKHEALEARALTDQVTQLASRMHQIHAELADLRHDLKSIKDHLRA